MTENTTFGGDAAGTYRWEPTGASCVACSASVERLWRDEDGLRCADCKSWS
ncbi:MAG: hypothetical protein ABEJ68_10555 [Halobacteriaceae archaeon]